MSQYSINQARSIAISCASKYDKKLKGHQFIVIYRDSETLQIRCIEVVFLARNYQHLTGLLMVNGDGKELKNCSEYFYKKCVTQKLGNRDIKLKADGTTQLKLEALPAITKFTSITKIVGDSNGKQPYLYVEKVVGGVNFCLGLRLDEEINEYVPVSALNKDIKKLTDRPSQVLAIMERAYGSKDVYKEIKHVAKGLNLRELQMPEDICDKISLEDYVPKE